MIYQDLQPGDCFIFENDNVFAPYVKLVGQFVSLKSCRSIDCSETWLHRKVIMMGRISISNTGGPTYIF